MPRPTRAACPHTARPDLWDLIDRARNGDAEAFGDFFDATVDQLYPYVLRRLFCDRDAVEDVLADVYLAAWRNIHNVRRIASSPVAWLRTIAARRVIDYHRAHARRTVPAGAPADLPAHPGTTPVAGPALIARCAEDIGLERVQAADLWSHVRQLAPEQHRVLLCRFYYGLTVQETATAIGKPPSAVKALQYRAMRALRGLLAGGPLDPHRDQAAAAVA